MGANNWASCPRCVKRAEKKRDDDLLELAGDYGKVPPEEYLVRHEAIKPVDPYSFQTFREDYEIHGADEGTVEVSYSGRCTVCNLRLDFNHEHDIPGVNE